MKMFPVKSSTIASVAHEPRTGLMEVAFKSGQTYRYGRVPEELFKEMVMSDSIGSFFHKRIKNNSAHPVTKVEDSGSVG